MLSVKCLHRLTISNVTNTGTLRRYVAKEKKRRETGAKSLFDTMKNDSGRSSRKINTSGARKKNVQIPRKNNGRNRTASVDFLMSMKHIQGAEPSSFSDMFSKDIILSFGEAAASGRLRAMSTDFGGRTRVTSTDRYLMEKLNGVDPIDLNENNKIPDVMDVDFDMPTLVGNDGETAAGVDTRKRRAKRDRNISLDILGLQYEPTAQKLMLSSSPYGTIVRLLSCENHSIVYDDLKHRPTTTTTTGTPFPTSQKPRSTSGVASLFTKNIGDLMRHRSSTANSITTFLEEDIDVSMVETPRAGAPSFDGIPDFGFSFEK